jgi:hypothetical protein
LAPLDLGAQVEIGSKTKKTIQSQFSFKRWNQALSTQVSTLWEQLLERLLEH